MLSRLRIQHIMEHIDPTSRPQPEQRTGMYTDLEPILDIERTWHSQFSPVVA